MMTINELLNKIDLDIVVKSDFSRKIYGGYCGDLLSNVMAKASKGDLWLTIQSHQNVIAVALLTEVAAVIVVENSNIEERAIERARNKNVNIFKTDLSSYELAGRLFELGIK
ncbi:MAG: DRTGG domain-containing protein [Halanaerobiales bacterium]